jgi:hypothetical protein
MSETTKIKGAKAVRLLRPLKLSRRVLKLPGSIWREDNPGVKHRPSNFHSIPVKLCGQVVQNERPWSVANDKEKPLPEILTSRGTRSDGPS